MNDSDVPHFIRDSLRRASSLFAHLKPSALVQFGSALSNLVVLPKTKRNSSQFGSSTSGETVHSEYDSDGTIVARRSIDSARSSSDDDLRVAQGPAQGPLNSDQGSFVCSFDFCDRLFIDCTVLRTALFVCITV